MKFGLDGYRMLIQKGNYFILSASDSTDYEIALQQTLKRRISRDDSTIKAIAVKKRQEDYA